MKNIVLKLAYDGTDFFGWQKTSSGLSVEEVLEKVLKKILNEEISLQAASRTDRGVHARGQIVNFFVKKDFSLNALLKSLNALLPKSIAVLFVKEAPIDFHPTLHALQKTYHYHICLGKVQQPQYRFYSWHMPLELDLNLMRKGAEFLLGEHDFSAFCNFRKNMTYSHKRRTLFQLEIFSLDEKRLRMEISANSFLYKMVRNIVGTLVYVGIGKLILDDLPKILAAKKRSWSGITAPAQGLFLYEILYPDNLV